MGSRRLLSNPSEGMRDDLEVRDAHADLEDHSEDDNELYISMTARMMMLMTMLMTLFVTLMIDTCDLEFILSTCMNLDVYIICSPFFPSLHGSFLRFGCLFTQLRTP